VQEQQAIPGCLTPLTDYPQGWFGCLPEESKTMIVAVIDAFDFDGVCNDPHNWVGDGWCDASLNNAGCNWDDGDCCAHSCVMPRTYTCGVSGGGYDCKAPAQLVEISRAGQPTKKKEALLVQEHEQKKDLTKASQNQSVHVWVETDGCTDGSHPVCTDPSIIDIEGFDCECYPLLVNADGTSKSKEEIRNMACPKSVSNVCCSWKTKYCGAPNTWPDLLETSTEGSSLDESLSGKRTCR